ncbi:hypothetical protein P20652_1687 [Pseudoalteromonas sp. BSi20652]|nr:hypothetical protein P20652_1687 [Pseudoalteromonas sp. BSi20652]
MAAAVMQTPQLDQIAYTASVLIGLQKTHLLLNNVVCTS